MEKVQEASALIHQHGFKLEFAPAKSRIDRLSAMMQQETGNGERRTILLNAKAHIPIVSATE